jgi:hypothetical protein
LSAALIASAARRCTGCGRDAPETMQWCLAAANLRSLAEAFDLEPAMTAKKPSAPPAPREVERIAQLRRVYGFDLVAADSHRLREQDGGG